MWSTARICCDGLSSLAVAQIVTKFAACSVKLRLIPVQFRTALAYFLQVVADFTSALKNFLFAGTIANIPTQLESVFPQLGVVLAQIGAAFLNLATRVSDIFKILPDLWIVPDSPIVESPVTATVESPVAAEIVATVVRAIEARMPPIIVAIIPPVAFVTFVVYMASAIFPFAALKVVLLLMPKLVSVVALAPGWTMSAVIGVGWGRKSRDHQRARDQPGEDNVCVFSHLFSPFVPRLFV
jgi:hypothetical protein